MKRRKDQLHRSPWKWSKWKSNRIGMGSLTQLLQTPFKVLPQLLFKHDVDECERAKHIYNEASSHYVCLVLGRLDDMVIPNGVGQCHLSFSTVTRQNMSAKARKATDRLLKIARVRGEPLKGLPSNKINRFFLEPWASHHFIAAAQTMLPNERQVQMRIRFQRGTQRKAAGCRTNLV